ncbi:MAG: hypothetical protein A3F84_12225 [Candidatus Handelsmanbacteria bacterium RIFCSPLOWO2_12_FULL_64_10]|uniref:Uncharacterized protein n=1 Tax=Handelsmanbacteria sp. (strain RIFCSPLOWO2_12_FULL_64_10) TaxID=1817868 RepID=A0A1F6C9R9_HANXR|nr:MAG: hypothetical protein A3F84_12225 [Candidatus Handelsmanbacteria bacterium RIFCSPLOWO2_12_FULL_64_10]
MIGTATLDRVYDEVKDDLLEKDEVRATANDFILTHLRDCFVAGKPRLVVFPIAPIWTVPILLTYPDRMLGEVGEVAVHALTGEVLGWTPFKEVEKNAAELRTHLASTSP